jgi:hypothetical protein
LPPHQFARDTPALTARAILMGHDGDSYLWKNN